MSWLYVLLLLAFLNGYEYCAYHSIYIVGLLLPYTVSSTHDATGTAGSQDAR